MKCLTLERTVKEFLDKYNENSREIWQIFDMKASDRVEAMQNEDYFKFLERTFLENIMEFTGDNKYQVISWLDSRLLMTRLFTDQEIPDDITIVSEYELPFSKQKRPDYLLVFKNTIIIVEFSISRYHYYQRENYDTKYAQAIQYESLVRNLVNEKTRVITFVCNYKPEYSEKGKTKESNIEHNTVLLDELKELIVTMYQRDQTAFEQLQSYRK